MDKSGATTSFLKYRSYLKNCQYSLCSHFFTIYDIKFEEEFQDFLSSIIMETMERINSVKVYLRLHFNPISLELTRGHHSHSLFNNHHKIVSDRIFLPSEHHLLESELIEPYPMSQGDNKVFITFRTTTDKNGQPNQSSTLSHRLLMKVWQVIEEEKQFFGAFKVFVKVMAVSELQNINIGLIAANSLGWIQSSSEDNEMTTVQIMKRTELIELLQQVDILKNDSSTIICHFSFEHSHQASIVVADLCWNSSQENTQIETSCLTKLMRPGAKTATISDAAFSQVCLSLKTFLLECDECNVLFDVESEQQLQPQHSLGGTLSQWVQVGKQNREADQIRNEISRQEALMKKLMEKHKTTLSILGKCMGLECTQVDRRTQILLDTSTTMGERRHDKFKIASNKRVENEALIEELEEAIAKEERELLQIKQQHSQNLAKVTAEKQSVTQELAKVHKQLLQLNNPQMQVESRPSRNNIYQAKPLRKRPDDTLRDVSSCAVITPSYLPSRKSVKLKSGLPQGQSSSDQIENGCRTAVNPVVEMRRHQLLTEIQYLLRKVQKQESMIQKCMVQRQEQFSGGLIQQLKKRVQPRGQLQQTVALLAYTTGSNRYSQWNKSEETHEQWLMTRERSQPLPTITTIRDI